MFLVVGRTYGPEAGFFMDMERSDIIRLVMGIIIMLLGVALFPVFLWHSPSPATVIMVVLAAAALGLVAGICLHPFVAEPIAEWFGRIYWPKLSGKVEKQYSRVRALVTQHDYATAIGELRQALAAEPEPLEGWLLLAGILHDHLHQSAAALDIIRQQLAARPWKDGNARLVLLGVDILLEVDATADAACLLRENIRKAGRSPAAENMQMRLQHLAE